MKAELHTEQLDLRALQIEDTTAFLHMIQQNHQRLLESFPNMLRSCSNLSATQLFFKQQLLQWHRREKLAFGIFEKGQQQMIGYISIRSIDWNIPKCELGYFIDKAYEGRGLATESLKSIVQYCFEELKMMKICLKIIPTNLGSKRVAIKAGFLWKARLKEGFQAADGRMVDIDYFVKFI